MKVKRKGYYLVSVQHYDTGGHVHSSFHFTIFSKSFPKPHHIANALSSKVESRLAYKEHLSLIRKTTSWNTYRDMGILVHNFSVRTSDTSVLTVCLTDMLLVDITRNKDSC